MATLAHLPTSVIEFSPTTDPGSAPVWVDITDYCRAWSFRRGRQHELDRFEAGTATLVLDNTDRRFDPSYTSGAYYPNVRPMRRIRIRATWSATTYELFNGFVESWPQEYQSLVNDAHVSVQAVDGSKVLNLRKIASASYSQELSGTRIANILTSAGWPAGDRDLDVGQSQMQAVTLAGDVALQEIQTTAESEGGFVFVSRDGKVTFIDRSGIVNAATDYANLTWGEGAGERKYSDVVIVHDDTDIWNDIRVTREGGTEQASTDATSQTRYLVRTLTKSGLLLTTDTEALNLGNQLLTRFAEPALRITSIKFTGSRDTADWPYILPRELLDQIRVKRNPPGGGTISQDSFIEGIDIDATPSGWSITWALSPVDRVTDYWVLGDATKGVLDSTTRLSW